LKIHTLIVHIKYPVYPITHQVPASIASTAGPDLGEVKAALQAATKGALVVMDRDLQLLTRIWCM
jgi:hypothetical protein